MVKDKAIEVKTQAPQLPRKPFPKGSCWSCGATEFQAKVDKKGHKFSQCSKCKASQ